MFLLFLSLLLRSKALEICWLEPHRHSFSLFLIFSGGIFVVDNSESDVGSLQRADVVCAVSTHHGRVSFFVKHGNYEILLIRRCSRENMNVLNYLGNLFAREDSI
jgi:hypothetical protein